MCIDCIYLEDTDTLKEEEDTSKHTPVSRKIKVTRYTENFQKLNLSTETMASSTESRSSSINNETFTSGTTVVAKDNGKWKLIVTIGTVCGISILLITLLLIGFFLLRKHNRIYQNSEAIRDRTIEPEASSIATTGTQENNSNLPSSAQLEGEDNVYELVTEAYSYSLTPNKAYGFTSHGQNVSLVQNEAYSSFMKAGRP